MDPQAKIPEISLPDDIVNVGRQPILDRGRATYGYELLYRDGNKGFNANLDGNQATARTMINSFMEFGLQKLVGQHKAFINLTKPFFTNMQPPLVDKSRLVLEVLENIEIDDDVINGIRKLHKNGYQIALDDYRFEAHWEPLLPFASIIKVDLLGLDLNYHAEQISALKQRGLLLLAEKVETREEYEHTLELGFDLFQGYFFAKPQIMSNRRMNGNQVLQFKLLSLINDPGCTIDELATLTSQDPKLSYKLLRLVNSAAVGLPQKVESIHQAVVFLGLDRMRAWASLCLMAGMNNSSPEIITTALVRAEMCQGINKALATGDPMSAYTIGLLSILDAIMDTPLQDLVDDLPLPKAMIDGLVHHTGQYGASIECTLAVEQYRWLDDTVAQILPASILAPIYIEALTRADEFRNSLS